MIIFLGISLSAKAPVEDTIFCSSNLKPGSSMGALPVASMILSACNTYSPSFPCTEISFFPVKVPCPLTYSTPFFLNKNSMPPVNPSTTFFFWFWTLSQWISGFSQDNPYWSKVSKSWYLWEIYSKVLEGMQPTFKQVPPREPLDSMQAVDKPS